MEPGACAITMRRRARGPALKSKKTCSDVGPGRARATGTCATTSVVNAARAVLGQQPRGIRRADASPVAAAPAPAIVSIATHITAPSPGWSTCNASCATTTTLASVSITPSMTKRRR